MLIDAALTAILLLAAGTVLLPGYLRFMQEHRLVEVNYRGESIPTACGLFLLLVLLIGYLLQKLTGWTTLPSEAEFVLAAVLVGVAGLLDDLIGDKKTKGIANHWRAWLQRGMPSTAVVKAAAAGAAGILLFAGSAASSIEMILHVLLLLLTTNAVNLMDVRPGRALKFYYLQLALLLAAASFGSSAVDPLYSGLGWVFLLPITAGAAVLTYADVKGRAMLGDTGANVLGFTLGCGWVWYASVAAQMTLILLLLGLHALTWKRSLTRMIEGNRWLSFIDGIGRERI
ncbi:hypothetical protein ACFQI7_11390 [Paenibacillus allorhizosphaerae]|uniref:UDP-N-acetylmuramyl pentapeptide phosphotransferase n=1 Tax=Paenibacillus allorhizosphaerae TaxID=2849866 RepID=A0ABM8VHH3_9BACL|nr:hypothetical protein [Paenibacillus allorhizosphaerae]CAG7642047.1 hypothetical protein PAECIP111802_02808 [Paenibacillus allorhizosphaerae]